MKHLISGVLFLLLSLFIACSSGMQKAKVFFIHLNHTNPAIHVYSKEYKTIIKNGFKVVRERVVIKL